MALERMKSGNIELEQPLKLEQPVKLEQPLALERMKIENIKPEQRLAHNPKH